MRTIFEKRMFLIIAFLIFFLWTYSSIREMGLNKTVGWAFLDKGITLAITYFACFLFLIGYGIIAVLKYSTNWYASIAHISAILLSFVLIISIISISQLHLI